MVLLSDVPLASVQEVMTNTQESRIIASSICLAVFKTNVCLTCIYSDFPQVLVLNCSKNHLGIF